MSSPEAYAKARQLIDDAHKQDPLYKARNGDPSADSSIAAKDEATPDEEAKQDEMAYADAMEKWIVKLIDSTPDREARLKEIPGGTYILRLAARCQHLQRFMNPRSSYPEGKASYLKWRRDLYTIQANRAKDFMKEAGISEEERDNVGIWVSKTGLKPGKEGGIWGTQVSYS
jgi:tRNAThr (cytosine32-N3)-methyltransferase